MIKKTVDAETKSDAANGKRERRLDLIKSFNKIEKKNNL